MGEKQDSVKKLTGAAGIVMLSTLLSRLTGFLRTLLISTNMMPKGYSDEFLLAFTLPDLVYDLLAGGAIAAALIPVLSTYLAKGNEKAGWKAISTFMNCTIVIMLVLEAIFFTFTGSLLGILAPGFNGDTGDKELLIRLTRILLLSAPFMMLAGQFMGILNSYKRFAIAAMGPVIYNLCTIVSIALFGGKSAELTAWGVVVGVVVFFAVQFLGAYRHFVNYKPRLFLGSQAFRKLLALAIPSLLSSTIIEINLIIARGYATYSDEGMLTLLNNANRTWQLPLGIFAQSIGIALLPTLSEHFASENFHEFKKILYKGLRVVFLLCVPCSLFMMILNQDIMRIIFKWGKYSEREVFFSGVILLAYSLALIFSSIMTLMTRTFYSIHDSKTPLLSGVFGILANYLFNAIFMNFTSMDIAGTALAYTITAFVNMIMLLCIFKRKTGVDIIAENFSHMVKIVIAAIPSGLVVFALQRIIKPNVESKISQILAIIPPVLVGGAVFWLVLVRFKIPETAYIRDLVRARFKQIKGYFTR